MSHGLGPLVCVSTALTGNRIAALLGDHLQPSMAFICTPTTVGFSTMSSSPSWFKEYSGQFRQMVWPPHFPDMNSHRALMGCGGNIHPYPRSSTYLIPGNNGQLFRWHGLTSLQKSSGHLWNRCHVELLHFARLEEVVHDTRYVSHDFWHSNVYCFTIHCRAFEIYTCTNNSKLQLLQKKKEYL